MEAYVSVTIPALRTVAEHFACLQAMYHAAYYDDVPVPLYCFDDMLSHSHIEYTCNYVIYNDIMIKLAHEKTFQMAFQTNTDETNTQTE